MSLLQSLNQARSGRPPSHRGVSSASRRGPSCITKSSSNSSAATAGEGPALASSHAPSTCSRVYGHASSRSSSARAGSPCPTSSHPRTCAADSYNVVAAAAGLSYSYIRLASRPACLTTSPRASLSHTSLNFQLFAFTCSSLPLTVYSANVLLLRNAQF